MELPAPEAAAIRGVIFDLWNTLAYTDFHPNPIAALASAFGLDAAPDWRKQIERAIMTRRLSGISEAIEAIAEATGRELSGASTKRDLILLWGEASNRSRIAPDALPALRSLREARDDGRRYRLGILSNTQSFDLDFIRREGLASLVDDICLSCDYGLLKPDPRLYSHAAGRLGLAPGSILMVGDNVTDDVEGALMAGLRAAHLDRRGLTAGSLASLADLATALTGRPSAGADSNGRA